jgi:chloramphenicol-sensitive protein RarD
VSEARHRGLLLVGGAYVAWGLLALYWKQLEGVPALELLANRIVLSGVLLTLLVARRRQWAQLRAVIGSRRAVGAVVVAAVLLTANWGCYIYGVTSGRVVDTALGYFMTPLTTVLVGVVVLHERLRRAQWIAVALATVALAVFTTAADQVPVLGLALALTWTGYSYLKRRSPLAAIEGLWAEAMVVAPLAVVTAGAWVTRGTSAYTTLAGWRVALVLGSGVVTTVPLVLFGAGARHISLVQVGLLQYINPVISFSLGVLVFHESMPAARLAGFALVWVALAVFGTDAMNSARGDGAARAERAIRRARRRAPAAPPG